MMKSPKLIFHSMVTVERRVEPVAAITIHFCEGFYKQCRGQEHNGLLESAQHGLKLLKMFSN